MNSLLSLFYYQALLDGGVASIGFKKVNVQLDTSVVLKSMVDQARMVVLKAVASATDAHVSPPKMESPKKTPVAAKPPAAEISSTDTHAASSTINIGSFRAAISLSPASESTRLQKARSSALRLNSVLHGKSLTGSASGNNLRGPSDSSGVRTVRSVRWDHLQAPKLTSALAPNPKKVRMVQSTNKLKSFKSFGRPHAGDFGSGPRNATFGEYGRPASAGLWGRDGRLSQHPAPGLIGAVDDQGNLAGGSADMNATFDLGNDSNSKTQSEKVNPLLHQGEDITCSSAAASGAALLGLSTTSAGRDKSPPPGSSMQRTATALESTLIKKWT